MIGHAGPVTARRLGALALALVLGASGACDTTSDGGDSVVRVDEPVGPVAAITVGELDAQALLDDDGFADTALGFFIQQPAGWRADRRSDGAVAVRFGNTVSDTDATGAAFANMLVGIDEAGPPSAGEALAYLEATVESAPDRFRLEYGEFELVAAQVQDLGRTVFAIVEFSYTDGNRARLHGIRALAVGPERVYVVAATTLEAAWPAYVAAIAASLASFTILGA